MAKRKVFDSFDPAPAGPTVSETLRGTRIAMGHELRDVASMLRIRYPYLQAIEDGRFEDLPGAAYAAGFLRSYAEYLGLDPEAIVARYKEEAVGALRQQQLYLPTPATEGRVPGGTLLLVTLVLAGIVYGGWYYLSATDRSVADLVPTLPDRLVSLLDTLPLKTGAPPATEPLPQQTAALPPVPAPAPAFSAPSAATATPAAPTLAAPAPGGAASSGAASAPVPPAPTPNGAPGAPAPSTVTAPLPPAKPALVAALPPPAAPAPALTPAAPGMTNVPPPPSEEDDAEGSPQEPTPLSPAAPPAAPAPRPVEAAAANPNAKVYGLQYQNVRLVLKATQESWLQIRDGSEIIFTRVLKPGDTYRVPDKAGVRVRTGNAGGLVVVAEGAESPPLGSVGQVLRDVPIDSHGVVRPAAR